MPLSHLFYKVRSSLYLFFCFLLLFLIVLEGFLFEHLCIIGVSLELNHYLFNSAHIWEKRNCNYMVIRLMFCHRIGDSQIDYGCYYSYKVLFYYHDYCSYI